MSDYDDADQLAEAIAERAAQTPEHVAELRDRAARVPLGCGPRVTPETVRLDKLRPGDLVQDDDGRRRTVADSGFGPGDSRWIVSFTDGGPGWVLRPGDPVTRLMRAGVSA